MSRLERSTSVSGGWSALGEEVGVVHELRVHLERRALLEDVRGQRDAREVHADAQLHEQVPDHALLRAARRLHACAHTHAHARGSSHTSREANTTNMLSESVDLCLVSRTQHTVHKLLLSNCQVFYMRTASSRHLTCG